MKVYRLELADFNDAEERKALHGLACDCQHIVNRIWQLWEAWHVANNSRAKIVKHLDADKKWRETKKGNRPKWSVDCLPKIPGKKNSRGNPLTLRNQIEADLGETFPHVHSRVRTLLANITFKKMTKGKATSVKLAAWMAILLNKQSRPSSTRPQPIPFDAGHSRVVPGATAEDDATLYVRLHRDAEAGRKVTEPTAFKLRTTGRRVARYVKPIVRMASGEWDYKGSSLYYDSRKRKWFALLVCELPPGEKSAAVEGSVALLRCGYRHPVQFRVNGRRHFLRNFGHGGCVAATRRQLLTQRWSRQENYRTAGSANKGHGLKRALGPVFLLSRRWKDFVKSYNHQLTTAVVQHCLQEGIETLIYCQPDGDRYLSEAGKIRDRHDSTGWDFYQISAMLAYKCQHHGIKLSVRKPDAKMAGAEG